MSKIKNWLYGIILAIGSFFAVVATDIGKIARHPEFFVDLGKNTGKILSHESDNIRFLGRSEKFFEEIDNAAKLNDAAQIDRIIAKNGDHVFIARFFRYGRITNNSDDFLRRMNNAKSSIEEEFGFLYHWDDKSKMIKEGSEDEFVRFIERRKKASIRYRSDIKYNDVLDKLLTNLTSETDNGKSLKKSIELKIKGNNILYNDEKLTDNQLIEIVKIRPKIFIEGNINQITASRFNEVGAKFVMNSKKIPGKRIIPRIIYVLQEDDPLEVVKSFKKHKYGIVVNNQEELIKEISLAKSYYKKPILVFNNSNGKLYNRPLSKYGVKDIITCKSYTCSSNSSFTLISNDLLNAEDVVNSLDITYGKYSMDFEELSDYIGSLKTRMAYSSFFKRAINIEDVIENNPGKTIFLDEFYYNFSLSYNKCIKNRLKRNVLVAVGFGTFTIGGCSTIVYISKK